MKQLNYELKELCLRNRDGSKDFYNQKAYK